MTTDVKSATILLVMEDARFSYSEPVSEGMRYGPVEPPKMHENPKLAELIMEEAGNDLGFYQLFMLRVQLIGDFARHLVSTEVYEQNYVRLTKEIAHYSIERTKRELKELQPPAPDGMRHWKRML